MLTENTGIAMMDSGGENGRGWQKNAGKTAETFKAEPAVTHESDGESIHVTVSAFHYLTQALSLDGTCEAFNALPCEDWDGDAHGISKAQTEWLTVHGLEIGKAWNTYNGESTLDTILQGANVSLESEAEEYPTYILMQVHGGADVRGGYTDAKLFKLEADYLNPCPDVYGTVDGVEVSTRESSYGTTVVLENGSDPKHTEASKIELYLSE